MHFAVIEMSSRSLVAVTSPLLSHADFESHAIADNSALSRSLGGVVSNGFGIRKHNRRGPPLHLHLRRGGAGVDSTVVWRPSQVSGWLEALSVLWGAAGRGAGNSHLTS